MSTSSKQEKSWQPWVMPQVQGKGGAQSLVRSTPKTKAAHRSSNQMPADLLRRALKEIESAKAQAMEQSKQQGFDAGYEQGFAQGLKESTEQGAEKGFAQGYAEGLAQAQTELAQLRQAQSESFQQLVCTAEQKLTLFDEQFGEQMIALSCALAKHIVQTEIDAQSHDLIPLIQRAVRHTLDEQPIIIKVHPDDAARLVADDRWQNHWQLQTDEQMNPGGFDIQAPWGLVDARLETRWKTIIKELLTQSTEDHESI